MPRRSAAKPFALVLTCEHGGNRVPRRYARAFDAPAEVLASHRGWDLGALSLAKRLARALHAPLFAATTTRLLIDLNRSLHHRRVFSSYSRTLAAAQREALRDAHYLPHRARVEAAIAQRIAQGYRVLHVAVHSFTPVLDGVERDADIGLLYDPRRASERDAADRLHAALAIRAPDLRVRRNYPYRGSADGFTTALRKRFRDADYAGIELELNQIHARRPPFKAILAALRAAL